MTLRPLRDRVVIKPLEFKHSILYVAGIELRKGTVVAVGPGRRLKRRIPWLLPYEVHAEGQSVQPAQTFYVEDGPETGKVAPMSVKPGDVVEYGFRDCFPFTFEGEKLLVVWEKNIYGLTDARQDSGILEPVSAAID
jgi:co-chaperonin GroES (HSP10)